MTDEAERSSSFAFHSSSLPLPRGRRIEFGRCPLVMGVVNVTPDSFSDGGVHFDMSKAVHAALQMEEDGAAVVDIGGESSRPGSAGVPAEEEMRRVIPVIEQIRRRADVPISIDTRRRVVAEAAIRAGADIVNDISAMCHDESMREFVARAGVPVVLMHMRGEPDNMQQLANYGDVVAEVSGELRQRKREAVAAGVQPDRIMVDPGIGFAKMAEHNLELLARCDELADIAPVLIGASRKAFIGRLTGREAGAERMVGSLAAVAAAFRGGAAMVRVHDVRETMDFLKVLSAIERHGRTAEKRAGSGEGRP